MVLLLQPNKNTMDGKVPNPRIRVHYIKTHDFRTHFASGVYGGATANGMIDMNFFLDRAVIPQVINYEFDGSEFKEKEKEGKDGYVREVSVGVIMDLQTAKVFRDWLNAKIEHIEKEESTSK